MTTPAGAWGETTSYVLENDGGELNTIETGPSLALTGPGATLTYQVRTNSFLGIQGLGGIYVQVSTDGGTNWSDLAHDDVSTTNTTKTHNISTDVTNIRFATKTGATLNKYYSNVKVTRATTFATSTTALDFGTVTNHRSNTLNAIVDYNNTTYNQQVTGTSTSPSFTVTATTVGATGTGQAVPVVFTPTTAGTHTGTVTLTMNGHSVSFQVTGVSQTTYYARATAVATEGGTARVSFTSFDEATNSSATATSGITTASSATATAYYRATPAQRHAFVGWKRALDDSGYLSTDADFQTTVTYNSESSSAPTISTLYAVFEQKSNDITLEPTASTYDADLYEQVTLHRTLLRGYNTIALPFATNVTELTGRTSDDDWVAQLSSVTYNAHDGYTLFFHKIASGHISAFQPYVLYLGDEVVDPQWTNIDLPEASPVTLTPSAGYGAAVSPDGSSYADWQMTSNFTAALDMNGRYGIVNSAGSLMRGAAGSTLNAFTAYITPPPGSAGVKTRSAFVAPDGTTTIVDDLPTDSRLGQDKEIYSLDGRRHRLVTHPGIYVIAGRKVVISK